MRRILWIGLGFLLICLTPATSIAHVPDEYDSIHFNSGVPDFGMLPARASFYGSVNSRELGGFGYLGDVHSDERKQELTEAGDENRAQAAEKRDRDFRSRARAAEARGQWEEARHVYAELAAANGWNGDLRDRSDVLAEAAAQRPAIAPDTPAAAALRDYLRALDDVQGSYGEKWSRANVVFAGIAAGRDGGDAAAFLKPYARYQIASLDVAWFNYPAAIAAFGSLLHDHPKFERREAALIMLARAAILPKRPEDRNNTAGLNAIHTLLADYPRTRFRSAALGLRARGDVASGRLLPALDTYFALDDLPSVEAVLRVMSPRDRANFYPRLLCSYLRRLDRATSYDRYTRTVEDVSRTIALVTGDGADVFLRSLRADPTLTAPYFYYRLYHCTNTTNDYRNLAGLASRLAADRRVVISPHIAVRFAEVFYQDHDDARALSWARIAAAGTSGTTPFDRALYVEGAVDNREPGHAGDARHAFETLLARCPNSSLRFAARENLAIADEASGDLLAALDQYFVLKYRPDIAYYLDARMTIPQVSAYVAARPASLVGQARHELLVYSLGIRQMRAENWAEARRCLESIPHRRYVKLWHGKHGLYESQDDGDGEFTFDERQPDPLASITALQRLQDAARIPQLPAAHAHALFEYARYYYDHGTLLLYNASLWQGMRELSFDEWWNDKAATQDDAPAIRAHMYSHEVYARTMSICSQIVKDYPETPTAPYALYRAACCASKLGHFNGWWDIDSRNHDRYRQAARLMRRVVREYPHCSIVADARKFAGVFHDYAADDDEESRKYPNTAQDRAGERTRGL